MSSRRSAQDTPTTIHQCDSDKAATTRLVFTWNSSNPQMNFGETLVTVDLMESEGSTEVHITHEGFPADEIRERHNQGWTKACDNLAKLLTEGGVCK